MFLDNFPVTFGKGKSRFVPAFAARKIVGGVNNLALWTCVFVPDLQEPFLKSDLPDPLSIFKKVRAVRPRHLELL